MIDPRFIFLGSLFSLSGAAVYVRDTWLGRTAPNRVTWTLWGLEPLLAYAVEQQEHVGLASFMTLVLGVVPIVVLAVSFHDPLSVWRIGRFDVVCGVISLVGLSLWVLSDQPTVGLIAFVAADAVAALPTLRKSFREPTTESWWTYCAGALFAAITLATVPTFSTAEVLFPLSVLTIDTVIGLLVSLRVGPRLRSRVVGPEGVVAT